MADFRPERRIFDARLARINLPWVKIENSGAPFPAVHLADGPMGKTIGEQPKKPAAACCDGAAAKPGGCYRQLDKRGISNWREGKTRRFGPAIMMTGKDSTPTRRNMEESRAALSRQTP